MANKLYKSSKRRLDQRKNKGFRYQNKILRMSIDEGLLKNSMIETMVNKIDVLLNHMINMVKQIKLNRNLYYEDDDYDLIN